MPTEAEIEAAAKVLNKMAEGIRVSHPFLRDMARAALEAAERVRESKAG